MESAMNLKRLTRPLSAVPAADPAGGRVLDALVRSGEALTVAQITELVGQHPNTVRSHLSLLVETGRVEAVPEERTRPGRPKLLYRAVAASEVADPYKALAAELAAAASDPGTSPGEAAGRRMARSQREKLHLGSDAPSPEQAVELATEGLEVLGFATSTDPLGDRLYLKQCPFEELARQDRAICRLHHEMLHGYFAELDSGVSVRRLDIFIKDDLCVAHLTRPDLRPAPAPAPADAPRPWEQ